MTNDELIAIVDAAARQVGEHVDHVQILCTWNEDGITRSLCRGVGNWHARQGMAHQFINEDIAQDTARQIAQQLKPDEDP